MGLCRHPGVLQGSVGRHGFRAWDVALGHKRPAAGNVVCVGVGGAFPGNKS